MSWGARCRGLGLSVRGNFLASQCTLNKRLLEAIGLHTTLLQWWLMLRLLLKALALRFHQWHRRQYAREVLFVMFVAALHSSDRNQDFLLYRGRPYTKYQPIMQIADEPRLRWYPYEVDDTVLAQTRKWIDTTTRFKDVFAHQEGRRCPLLFYHDQW